jgi:CheY-like chemotaxis protein
MSQTTTAQRRTVLVVDDDLSTRGMLIRILGRSYDISTAHDGERALFLFSHGQRFDVVLCDLMMPTMDGAVFLQHLRRLDADQASRVIMLTANAHAPLATNLAGHYVVEKPFDMNELRELVARVSAAAHDGYFPSRAAS